MITGQACSEEKMVLRFLKEKAITRTDVEKVTSIPIHCLSYLKDNFR